MQNLISPTASERICSLSTFTTLRWYGLSSSRMLPDALSLILTRGWWKSPRGGLAQQPRGCRRPGVPELTVNLIVRLPSDNGVSRLWSDGLSSYACAPLGPAE